MAAANINLLWLQRVICTRVLVWTSSRSLLFSKVWNLVWSHETRMPFSSCSFSVSVFENLWLFVTIFNVSDYLWLFLSLNVSDHLWLVFECLKLSLNVSNYVTCLWCSVIKDMWWWCPFVYVTEVCMSSHLWKFLTAPKCFSHLSSLNIFDYLWLSQHVSVSDHRQRLTLMREIYNEDLSPDTPEAKQDIFHCLSACGQQNVFNFRTLIPSR